MPHILRGLLVLTTLLAFNTSSRAELIINGDFESTTLSNSVPDGWIATGEVSIPPRAYTGSSVIPLASGAWAVTLGPSGSDAANGGTLSQTFFVSTPGTYAFSFDYTREQYQSDLADFSWFLSGAVTDSNSLFGVGSGYQTFSETYSIAAPGNVTVGFTDIIGNGHAVDAVIDNVSFTSTAVTAVPEPSSGVLATLGAALIAFLRKKKLLSRNRVRAILADDPPHITGHAGPHPAVQRR